MSLEVTRELVMSLLQAPRAAFDITEELREKTIRLEAQATKTTPQLTGMPNGGGSDKEKTWVALVESREKWAKAVQDRVRITEVVRELIDNPMMNNTESTILAKRYIMCSSWLGILDKLKVIDPMSERKMYDIHSKAITKIMKYMEEDKWIEKNEWALSLPYVGDNV